MFRVSHFTECIDDDTGQDLHGNHNQQDVVGVIKCKSAKVIVFFNFIRIIYLDYSIYILNYLGLDLHYQ